jgi:hypothetical protein
MNPPDILNTVGELLTPESPLNAQVDLRYHQGIYGKSRIFARRLLVARKVYHRVRLLSPIPNVQARPAPLRGI